MTYEEVELKLCAARKAVDNGDYAAAEDSVRAAENSVQTADHKAEVLHLLGVLAVEREEYTQALELLHNAESIARGTQQKSMIASIFTSIGFVHWKRSDYSEALESHSRALALFKQLDDKSGVARATNNIGSVYQGLSDYPKALEHYTRALILHEELAEKSGVASVTGNMGNVYLKLSDYSKALECYTRALDLHEELGEKSGIARVTGNIGNVYQNLSDYPRALEYYGRSLSLREDLGEKSGIAHVIGNLGIVSANISDNSKALEYFGRALVLYEELEDKIGTASVTGNIGLVYKRLSDFSQALEYYTRALSLYRELGAKHGIARVTGNLGALYAHHENAGYDSTLAVEYLSAASAMFEQIGAKADLFDCHKDLADLYEHEGQLTKALLHYKKYHELKEEVLSEESKKKAEQIDYQRKEAERENQRAILKARDEERISSQEGLLNRMLPPSISQRLLKGERVADYYRDISILFADIVGFTPIASRMPAKAVLAFLNHVFGEFDAIMEKNGCQKIKTMGDGYMAVCGAPLTCEDHAERLASAALELMNGIELSEEIRRTLPKDSAFHLRIGLHLGPAFAGIVGEKGFVYDVYSDAVNLAARMESSGEAGRIHCSSDFAYHLQNRDESFALIERGEVEIKGKGSMRTYFLEKRHDTNRTTNNTD